ncbi:hypothetical protein FLA105534_04318 [Flavobacterium bizetiae]|uniref:Uncharacterized protein n=1 Tax=Flavobacterium bizetiae TaxID=2704140 RepID=A0A6J4GVQ7_9FLAO|nr:hypothetical protein [Flavobacterium bizetiae]CAA9202916.1 hypothetical protein FLA105534_04318 [Flavobacterium bizetiae]CAD5344879.1 hypothetical protein FLA105535_04891 [Flavobacterium bizetiae]CAD5349764.1 hypothetical protein FLA105534_03751 [Flavobacterium bizetiae]
MKTINNLNYFFVSVPIFLIALGLIINESSGNLVGSGILFLILTGLFQLISGIKMFIDEPHDKSLRFYIAIVVLFFLLWFVNAVIIYQDFISHILYLIPPILTIFFSTITYKKAHQ